ncbi:hypothetical protein Scep_019318 [Stephania cephalantha]|uniref:Uncharacterized protein n=1 Tax=Stephania cephalantha TaxID=152367 RepID=A0AAP0IAG7_9MAGN
MSPMQKLFFKLNETKHVFKTKLEFHETFFESSNSFLSQRIHRNLLEMKVY